MILGLAVLALAATGAACSESGPASASSPSAASAAGLPDRDPALAKRLVKDENAVLLDVRTPREFAAGAIPGAVNIPVQELGRRMAEIEQLTGGDKGHAIVVYCRSGRRSGIAKDALLDAGYGRVTNLGPKEAW